MKFWPFSRNTKQTPMFSHGNFRTSILRGHVCMSYNRVDLMQTNKRVSSRYHRCPKLVNIWAFCVPDDYQVRCNYLSNKTYLFWQNPMLKRDSSMSPSSSATRFCTWDVKLVSQTYLRCRSNGRKNGNLLSPSLRSTKSLTYSKLSNLSTPQFLHERMVIFITKLHNKTGGSYLDE